LYHLQILNISVAIFEHSIQRLLIDYLSHRRAMLVTLISLFLVEQGHCYRSVCGRW